MADRVRKVKQSFRLAQARVEVVEALVNADRYDYDSKSEFYRTATHRLLDDIEGVDGNDSTTISTEDGDAE